MTTIDPQRVLNLPMPANDAGAATVREYLIELLAVVWDTGDGLNPFGNSGWKLDLHDPLVKAGLIPGEVNEDGYAFPGYDRGAANKVIADAIRALGAPAAEVTP